MRSAALWLAIATAVFFVAGVTQAQPDPRLDRGFTPQVAEYDLGEEAFACDDPACVTSSQGLASEMQAEVYYPAEINDAGAGPFPLVIFLHGNHFWCYDKNGDGGPPDPFPPTAAAQWPCPAGTEPIPNHLGYAYLGEVMASQGFIVASIAATGINARSGLGNLITERAFLVEEHLDLWNTFNTTGHSTLPEPFASQLVGKVDLRNVGTMGHSRGGDGVVKHYERFSATSPYRVSAVLPIAATDYLDTTVDDVPVGFLLSYCDGDVYGLWSTDVFNRSRYNDPGDQASMYTWLSLGTNHNYFNSIWTPECWTDTGNVCYRAGLGPIPNCPDDPTDPECFTHDDWTYVEIWDMFSGPFTPDSFCSEESTGNGRLTPAEQREVALTYVPAFFRYHLLGEEPFGVYLRGDATPPDGVEQEVFAGYHPPAFRRLDLNRLDTVNSGSQTTLTGEAGMAGQVTTAGGLAPVQCTNCNTQNPTVEAGFSRYRVTWNAANQAWRHGLPQGARTGEASCDNGGCARDISLFSTLQFRVGVDVSAGLTPQDLGFTVALEDGSGVESTLSTADQLGNDVLFAPPGDLAGMGGVRGARATMLSTARLNLSDLEPTVPNQFPDLTDIVAVEFRFDDSAEGSILINDIAFTTEVQEMASDVVVVIDRSGSMDEMDFLDPPDNSDKMRIDFAKEGASYFAGALDAQSNNRLGLVWYNQNWARLSEIMPVADVDADTLIGGLSPSGRTSMGGGFLEALTMLEEAVDPNNYRRQAILLMTDGRQNEPPCMGIPDPENGGLFFGNCTPDPADNYIENRDPRLTNIPICSLGIGRSEGQVDEAILETFSSSYIDATSSELDIATEASEFVKCIPTLSESKMAIDPEGFLQRGEVAAPAHTYDSAADQQLEFLANWSATASDPGDMRLMVSKPNGDLLLPFATDRTLNPNWQVQFERRPVDGDWRFQVMRESTRIVNGFTSNAFVDSSQGISLVRRQVQRLCPDGCDKVLYYEDVTNGSQPSVYSEVLAAEQASGLVTSVETFSIGQAGDFDDALAAADYDMLIYVNQIQPFSTATLAYDETLESVLCDTDVPAIITDTRAFDSGVGLQNEIAVNVSSSLALTPRTLGTAVASANKHAVRYHSCSGVTASAGRTNFEQMSVENGTLLDAPVGLVDQGYSVYSYGVAPIPFDSLGLDALAATQLEAGSEVSYVNVSAGVPLTYGAIATASADQAFSCGKTPGSGCFAPRNRDLQRWASQINFKGFVPVTPILTPTSPGAGVTISIQVDDYVPKGEITGVTVTVDVIYPVTGIDDVFTTGTCLGAASLDDPNNGDKCIYIDEIPYGVTSVTLTDDGTGGDAVAGDGIYTGFFPEVGEVTGTIKTIYGVDFTYEDEDGVEHPGHREGVSTQYVGDEVPGNGQVPPRGTTDPEECVGDTEPPLIGAVDDASFGTCSDLGASSLQLTPPTATDNCAVANVAGWVSASTNPAVGIPTPIINGSVSLPVGDHTITWVAVDSSGNFSETSSVHSVTVQPSLFASDSVFLRDNVSVVGSGGGGASIFNAGDGFTEIGNDVTVGGVVSVANVKVWHRASVEGNLVTSGTADIEPTAVIQGSITEGATVTVPPTPDLSDITFPTTPGSEAINPGPPVSLPPGEYGQVSVNSGGELILEGGDYYFEALYVNSVSSLIQATAMTRVFVKNDMALRSSFVDTSGVVVPVFVGYAGSSVTLEADFTGTFVAPNATVAIGTGNAMNFSGSVYAQTIDLRNNATFSCEDSASVELPGSCADGVQNQGEEAVDCGGPCPPCETCSDGIQNQGEEGVDCGGPCLACATCNDGMQNQGEEAVDCGGPCPACPTCEDGVQNQGEAGVDCGGPCAACPTCDDGEQNQGEEGVDCGGPCPESCGASCTPSTYEAESMFHSTGGSTPGGWNIWANGYISTSHPFDGGPSSITVRARGNQVYGVWSHMVVSVGGVAIGNAFVTSSSWQDYSFAFTAASGSQEVRVAFDNDAYYPPYDRNLYIDNVTVECVSGGGGELSVELPVPSDWGSGYCLVLEVTNLEAAPTTDWQVVLDFPQATLGDNWNANFSVAGGQLTIDPFSPYDVINPGQTMDSIGFCANRTGGSAVASLVSASASY